MTVEDVLERAAEVGLDVIAITDHNEIAGGLEALALAERYGVRVIVGEEVKTAEGEVIGLFLKERIAPGHDASPRRSPRSRRQGGVVYVPHPFDRLHTVPGSLLLKANLTEIDVIEVFNSRIAYPGFNEKAVRFAERHRVPAAAGSDAHVLPGLGTALTGMGEFTGPDDFVEALSGSHIIRRPRSLLYLQSLKLLQAAPRKRRRSADGAAWSAGRVARARRSGGAQEFPERRKIRRVRQRQGRYLWDSPTRSTTST